MSRSQLTFSPEEARRVLWVHCLEEADATGALVSADARASASREADTPNDTAFLNRRASLLEQRLPANLRQPELPPGTWIDRLPAWSPWAIVAAAFLLGWFTNELGPSGRISLLSFPLLGLIAWNLVVCALSVWTDWKAKRKIAPALTAPRRMAGTDALTAARTAFQSRALAWEKPRRNARIKWVFHAAAIALAAGVVAGMYARGLGREYKATWESTFLERPQVQALTGAVLGPASLITGIPLPPVPNKGGEVPAAAWIHLWAASALLFIGIPRLLLANMARMQMNKAQPDYDTEFEGWLEVCRALTSEQTLKADVIPVHYEAEPRVRDGLRMVLQRLWGMHVGADFRAPVGYAEEQSFSLEMRPDYLVLLFPLATTPESEVHGALIQEMAKVAPDRHRRLIALDASGFEARFRTLPEYPERLAARRAAWEKIAGGAFPVLLLDEAARRDPAAAARSVFPT